MPQEKLNGDLYVVTILTKEEQNELYDLCVKSGIKITYPKLFSSKKVHHLFGINQGGVGLVGTVIARNTPKDHILNVNQLKKILR
mgnify:CR=1 FL=1